MNSARMREATVARRYQRDQPRRDQRRRRAGDRAEHDGGHRNGPAARGAADGDRRRSARATAPPPRRAATTSARGSRQRASASDARERAQPQHRGVRRAGCRRASPGAARVHGMQREVAQIDRRRIDAASEHALEHARAATARTTPQASCAATNSGRLRVGRAAPRAQRHAQPDRRRHQRRGDARRRRCRRAAAGTPCGCRWRSHHGAIVKASHSSAPPPTITSRIVSVRRSSRRGGRARRVRASSSGPASSSTVNARTAIGDRDDDAAQARAARPRARPGAIDASSSGVPSAAAMTTNVRPGRRCAPRIVQAQRAPGRAAVGMTYSLVVSSVERRAGAGVSTCSTATAPSRRAVGEAARDRLEVDETQAERGGRDEQRRRRLGALGGQIRRAAGPARAVARACRRS